MHSLTLYGSAGALLVSGLLCLGLLLKRTPSSRLGSSTSILSISDMSSSLLTSLALLLHRFYLEPDVRPIAGRGESPGSCEFGAVFYQYAVFLVPFANAFVSLLSFSTSCYAGASRIERRCSRLMETALPELTGKTRRPYGTGLAILSQWLLPVLFGGVFQLAEHRGLELVNRTTDELGCTLAANFPFENCAEELSEPFPSSSSVQDYLGSDDNLLWPSPNSSETLELVSRIYAIVQTALNDSKAANATLMNEAIPHRRFFIDEDGPQYFRCAKNRCIVSRRFLQVNLFLFLSLVYFVPILASALLLVASRYKCREVGRMIKYCRARNESPAIGEQKDEERCSQFAEATCELSCEADRMQSFYRLFKLNIVLAVSLWSPLFLQVISKTFFCSNVPSWLVEVAFFATIVFGVVRNALDLNVAKIDAEAEESKKRNSVHPDS